MNKSITIHAPAKINLCLDITGRTDNGYHLIESVFQSVSIYDTVMVSLTQDSNITVKTDRGYIPNGMKNIAYKAAVAFFEFTQIKNVGVDIFIKKNIPSQAGMGGGSSDAASTLKALDKLLDTKLTYTQICSIGIKIGADIPFFIKPQTALVSGIGEKIDFIDIGIPYLNLVIAKGKKSISTVEAYRKIDDLKNIVHPDTNALIKALREKNLSVLSENCKNVFEQVSDNAIDEVNKIKSEMIKNNALCSCMTGSGSAVFGIFSDKQSAFSCAESLKTSIPFVKLCKPC